MRIIPRRSVNVGWPELKAVGRALFSDRMINGPDIASFEKKFAEYIGAKHAAAVPSARIGLWVILKALGCRKGEGVILSAFNFPVIPSIIRSLGLQPVFADIIPQTFNVDPSKIETKITKNTKCILVTHLFGQPADMDPVLEIAKRYGLPVVEDCAHACGSEYHGKRTGILGEAGCFSFGIGKSLVAFGGGMITTNDGNLYDRIRKAMSEFTPPKKAHLFKKLSTGFLMAFFTKKLPFLLCIYPVIFILNLLGLDPEELLDSFEDKASLREKDIMEHRVNFANIQAVLGLEQLKKIGEASLSRFVNSQALTEYLLALNGIKIPTMIPDVKSSGLYYPVRTDDPFPLKQHLIRRGIDSKISSQKDCSGGQCPYAASLDGKIIKIPNSHGLSRKDMAYINGVLADYFKRTEKCP